MKIKDLFTVPEGQKVTEKVFHRVLISSICSILLCMSCLVSTTWAWFTVSIENQGNEIQIVEFEVSVTQGGALVAEVDGAYPLSAGTIDKIVAKVNSGAGSGTLLKSQKPYVVMTVKIGEQTAAYYSEGALVVENLSMSAAGTVSFNVQWELPNGITQWGSDILVIGEEFKDPSEVTGASGAAAPSETTAAPNTTGTPAVSDPSETTVAAATPEVTTAPGEGTTAGSTENEISQDESASDPPAEIT